MSTAAKLITFDDMENLVDDLGGGIVVATNGCFDVLHVGHTTYLEQARNLGGHLVVGINGDESVRALKGPSRPVNPETSRALVIAALECVSRVVIFPEVRAVKFLEALKPSIWCKAGDYSLETIDPGEREALERIGTRIVFLPIVHGISTTQILSRLHT